MNNTFVVMLVCVFLIGISGYFFLVSNGYVSADGLVNQVYGPNLGKNWGL